MKGSRTIVFSAALAALGVLEAADWTNLVGDQNAGVILLAVGAVSAALRAVTNTPVFKGE